MSRAERVFAEEGITFYDCSSTLRERIQDDYSSITIAGDGHPDENGARLIADLNWPPLQSFLTKINSLHAPFHQEGTGIGDVLAAKARGRTLGDTRQLQPIRR
jgi:hypothetical protein